MLKFALLLAKDMVKDTLRNPEFPSFVTSSGKRAALAARGFPDKERCTACGGVGYVAKRPAAPSAVPSPTQDAQAA